MIPDRTGKADLISGSTDIDISTLLNEEPLVEEVDDDFDDAEDEEQDDYVEEDDEQVDYVEEDDDDDDDSYVEEDDDDEEQDDYVEEDDDDYDEDEDDDDIEDADYVEDAEPQVEYVEEDDDYDDTLSTVSDEEDSTIGEVNSANTENTLQSLFSNYVVREEETKMSNNQQQTVSNEEQTGVEISENRKQYLLQTNYVKSYFNYRDQNAAIPMLVHVVTNLSELVEYLEGYELSKLQAEQNKLEQGIVLRDEQMDNCEDDETILRLVKEKKELKKYYKAVGQIIDGIKVLQQSSLYTVLQEVQEKLKEG